MICLFTSIKKVVKKLTQKTAAKFCRKILNLTAAAAKFDHKEMQKAEKPLQNSAVNITNRNAIKTFCG